MGRTPLTFEKDLQDAIDCLRKGGVILYPTDTIWGLGCDATNEEAIKKIYALKKRTDAKSMLVLTDSVSALEKIVDNVPDVAYELIEASVNPLTIIYDKAVNVAPGLLAPDGSLGVRITEETFSKELCRRFGKPVVSTSANISGEDAPTCFSQISEEIKKGADYTVNYRQNDCTPSKPSNIIKLTNQGNVTIIR